MGKTAIVIGATGLVGQNIVEILCKNDNYSKIKIFTRRRIKNKHPKIKEYIVDFDSFENFSHEITGDELFSAMGTTIKKAKSKDNQYKVDYTYQFKTAEYASVNGVKKYMLVSSIGANEKSSVFYTKIKGKLDNDVLKLNFENIMIFRPSILVGDRHENRTLEKVWIILMSFFTKIIPPLYKYKPIPAKTVAQAMIKSAFVKYSDKNVVFESSEIFDISKS